MATLTRRPQPADVLAMSQGDILNNFLYLQAALDQDHIVDFGIDETTDDTQGRHNQVSLFGRNFASLAVPAGMDALLSSFQGNLYFRNSVMTSSVQLTNANVMPSVTGGIGYTFLPGGLMLVYGKTAIDVTQPQTINFPNSGFDSPPYSVTVTTIGFPNAGSGPRQSVSVTATAAGNFTVGVYGFSVVLTDIYWMAIGPKA